MLNSWPPALPTGIAGTRGQRAPLLPCQWQARTLSGRRGPHVHPPAVVARTVDLVTVPLRPTAGSLVAHLVLPQKVLTAMLKSALQVRQVLSMAAGPTGDLGDLAQPHAMVSGSALRTQF